MQLYDINFTSELIENRRTYVPNNSVEKFEYDFDVDGQLELIAPEVRSNRNLLVHVEIISFFQNFTYSGENHLSFMDVRF